MQPAKSGQSITELDLPFQTMENEGVTYKLFAIVTHRDLEGNALIGWHRERWGKSEQVHSIQKTGLAGGQLPSHLFGVNAAWWQTMILAFNLNRLMQITALPNRFHESHRKALRFHVIQLPGRVIHHAKQFYVLVEKEVHELYRLMRNRIAKLSMTPKPLLTSEIPSFLKCT